jgi:hypothetical protein
MGGSIHDLERAAAKAVAGLSSGNTYAHWRAIALGVAAGRESAMQAAGVNSPYGSRYRQALKDWQTRNPWSQDKRLAHPVTSYCAWMVENLAAVEAWRATLTPQDAEAFNHPATIRRQFLKAQGAGGFRARAGASPQGNPNRPTKAMLEALRQALDQALQIIADRDQQIADLQAKLAAACGLNGYAKFPLLGFEDGEVFTEKQVSARHRGLSTVFHPDKKTTGSDAQMTRLNLERDKALKEATRPGGTVVSAP